VGAPDGHRVSVHQLKREVVGTEDILAYLESVRAGARRLDATVHPNEDQNFWTADRVKRFGDQALIPGLASGAMVVESVAMMIHPEVTALLGPPAAAFFAGGVYVYRRQFRMTGRFLRAVLDPAQRESIIDDEAPRARRQDEFLCRKMAELREGRVIAEAGPIVIMAISPRLANLLRDVPAAGAHPTEVRNHHDLLVRELARVPEPGQAEDPARAVRMHLDLELETEAETGRPKLVITANLVEFSSDGSTPPRGRREPPAAIALMPVESAAVLVPIPVRVKR
jgi:hypothetical protein